MCSDLGQVIENFGTVLRSVLDGFPIVLLWFFISPMASRIPLATWCSACTFFHGKVYAERMDGGLLVLLVLRSYEQSSCGATVCCGRGIQRSFWRCEAAFQAVYYKGPWPFINRAWGKAAWHRIRWAVRGMNRTRAVIDLLHDGGEALARMVAMETSYWSH